MDERKTRVLIVDDDAGDGSALGHLLRAEGFVVAVAEHGRAALQRIVTHGPDVVVSDLRMPIMDGLGLLDELRARGVDAPVIMVTGMNDVRSAVDAIRRGAADYLTKPIDADALLFAIERALRTRDLLREAAALRLRNEELVAETERNVRAREELLSILVHDLRGPLATISLASSPSNADDDPARALDIVRRAAARMSRLVEDLLDVSRIETGGLELDLASHDASRIVQDAIGVLEPKAAADGVRLDANVPADFSVTCAFERLVQALVNLGSNAIDATPAGRRVTISAERRGDRAFFRVEDDGAGIAADHLGRVFDRGFRTSAGKRRGAGLGLTIVKGIVEAHGGAVRVASKVGAGTTFELEIPLLAAEHASWRVAAV